MHHKEFINQLDEAQIVAAIASAENKTSGEIRVYVTHHKITDALARAKLRFTKLGMEKTRHRNAVLIYLAPRSRKFAIVGDTGVHEKCGDGFWREVSTAMEQRLRNGQFSDAVLTAVEKVGELLIAQFPRRTDDTNELPDGIGRD